MIKIFDDVLGREEKIQGDVTPENEKEIVLKDVEPQIPFEEALREMEGKADGMQSITEP